MSKKSEINIDSPIDDLAKQIPDLAHDVCKKRINMRQERDMVRISGTITFILACFICGLCVGDGANDKSITRIFKIYAITTCGVFGLASMGILLKTIRNYIKASRAYKTSERKFNEIVMANESRENAGVKLKNDGSASTTTNRQDVTPPIQYQQHVLQMTEQWMRDIMR